MICWCCGPGCWLAVAVPLGLASSLHAFSDLHASDSAAIVTAIVIDPPGFSRRLGLRDGRWAPIAPANLFPGEGCSVPLAPRFLSSPRMYIHQRSGLFKSKMSIFLSVSPPISSYSPFFFPASSHSVFLLSSRLREKAVSCILIPYRIWVSSSKYIFPPFLSCIASFYVLLSVSDNAVLTLI